MKFQNDALYTLFYLGIKYELVISRVKKKTKTICSVGA